MQVLFLGLKQPRAEGGSSQVFPLRAPGAAQAYGEGAGGQLAQRPPGSPVPGL